MSRFLVVSLLLIAAGGILVSIIVLGGLPMRALPPPDGALLGSVDAVATDLSRPDLFSGAAQRVIPFQMIYAARSPGTYARYVPDAGPVIDAFTNSHGWISRVMIGKIGQLAAPWTDNAEPSEGGPFPVILYLPGVTGYIQMGSFQTTAMAAQGYIVVTLNQPGAVAAAVFPDGQVVQGLTRDNAAALIDPSYLATDLVMPDGLAQSLSPEISIIPYFAADVPVVIDRLVQINADRSHILYGLFDLDRIGVMGMSLGAIVTAQACVLDTRIGACLMMDAPVPTDVAVVGLRQPALWISRPREDQLLERAASGGWPDNAIAAQSATIAAALSNSDQGQIVQLQGLFHIDFTDLPALQPVLGWLGQSGPAGVSEAHRQINRLTIEFFAAAIGKVVR